MAHHRFFKFQLVFSCLLVADGTDTVREFRQSANAVQGRSIILVLGLIYTHTNIRANVCSDFRLHIYTHANANIRGDDSQECSQSFAV